LRENPTVASIAARHNKSAAQVLLRWHVQQGLVPIPQASAPIWLRENISIFDFALSTAEMQALNRLDRGESAARDSDVPETFPVPTWRSCRTSEGRST
jgi:2,5-diketo-D-gluconate reductase A